MFDLGLMSSGTTFLPNFVKISEVVQKLWGDNTHTIHHGYLIKTALFTELG